MDDETILARLRARFGGHLPAQLEQQLQQALETARQAIAPVQAPLGGRVELPAPAAYPIDEQAPEASIHHLIDDYVRQSAAAHHWTAMPPGDFATGRAVLALGPTDRITAGEAILARLAWHAARRDREWRVYIALGSMLGALRQRALPYDDAALVRAVEATTAVLQPARRLDQTVFTPLLGILKHVERHAAEHGLSAALRARLEGLRETLPQYETLAAFRKAARQVDDLLGGQTASEPRPGEPWSDAALADLAALPAEARAHWLALLAQGVTASGSRPSAAWLKKARARLDAVGEAPFARHLARWLPLLRDEPEPLIPETNGELLKGLIWCAALVEEASLAAAVGEAAEVCFKKIPQLGARSTKLGNACLVALGAMPGLPAVTQLARLSRRVKYQQAQATIAAALEAAAGRAGLSRAELEELVVPTYGLDETGRRREPLGDHAGELAVTERGRVELRWLGPDGRPLKALPAAVAAAHAETVASLKKSAAEIETMLPAQRERIERLFLSERDWPLDAWRERYLDHPLLLHLTRRLLWEFRDGDRAEIGIWRDGRLVDRRGAPLDGLSESTRVRLWHPLGATTDLVLAWRRWLEEHEIPQPFKQAYREIYPVTDAELATETYSNRFAGHILRQHQFHALCGQKGWRYRLQGQFDGGGGIATLNLPEWGLEVDFWTDGGDQDGPVSDHGISLYVATDQVRFTRHVGATMAADAGAGPHFLPAHRLPLRLAEVPPLVFSEVMRQVDLFVSVASIGNDPTWQDRGDNPARFGAYWQTYAFGDLSASAETRREALARLIPRLAIAPRCTLADRYLHVRGDLRTYKIHLGSGNILMEPNDQYLCIVQDRRARVTDDPLYLPFEGDALLSLILSKARLLAQDTKIKDPSIMSQIKRQ